LEEGKGRRQGKGWDLRNLKEGREGGGRQWELGICEGRKGRRRKEMGTRYL
jgi:hypothetical protein